MAINIDLLISQMRARFPSDNLERVEQCIRYTTGRDPIPQLEKNHEPTRLFFPSLRATPWYEPSDFPWAQEMERRGSAIYTEFLRLLEAETRFVPYEDPYTKELGWAGWEVFSLYRRGLWHEKNAAACPQTVGALNSVLHGVRQAMFTKLQPGAHILPHTGGVNVMLTCHLGLITPPGCAIRVGEEERVWERGKCLLFDDSFIHEAWNRGDLTRTVLLWDVWHPDLALAEIKALEWLFPIFDRYLAKAN